MGIGGRPRLILMENSIGLLTSVQKVMPSFPIMLQKEQVFPYAASKTLNNEPLATFAASFTVVGGKVVTMYQRMADRLVALMEMQYVKLME